MSSAQHPIQPATAYSLYIVTILYFHFITLNISSHKSGDQNIITLLKDHRKFQYIAKQIQNNIKILLWKASYFDSSILKISLLLAIECQNAGLVSPVIGTIRAKLEDIKPQCTNLIRRVGGRFLVMMSSQAR